MLKMNNMTRLERRKTFQEQELHVNTGIFGLVDSVMLKIYRITNNELDKICKLATDDELELFTKEDRTITESKRLIDFLNNKIYHS